MVRGRVALHTSDADRQAVAVRPTGGPRLFGRSGGSAGARPRVPPRPGRFASSQRSTLSETPPSQTAPTEPHPQDGKIQDQEETMFSRKMMSAMRSSVGVIAALVRPYGGAAQAQSTRKDPRSRSVVRKWSARPMTCARWRSPSPRSPTRRSARPRPWWSTAKSAGITTLVVYNEGARYKVYDVEAYVPNGDKQVALHVRIAEVNDNASARARAFDWSGQHTGADGFWQGGLYHHQGFLAVVPAHHRSRHRRVPALRAAGGQLVPADHLEGARRGR